MRKQLMTIAALGLGAIAMASMAGTAEAGGKHGHGFGHGHGFKHGHKWHGHRHWRKHRFYGGYYNYAPRCGYYLRKARWTGSGYWWAKYERCTRYWY